MVDGRVKDIAEIEQLAVLGVGDHPIRIGDFAKVVTGEQPVFNVVTADGA